VARVSLGAWTGWRSCRRAARRRPREVVAAATVPGETAARFAGGVGRRAMVESREVGDTLVLGCSRPRTAEAGSARRRRRARPPRRLYALREE
jgi:hypothetical protein